MKKNIMVVAISTFAIFSGLVMSASPAFAANTYLWSRYNSVQLYHAPSRTQIKLDVSNNTRFRMTCWATGQWINVNYGSSRWFYGQEYTKGVYGWVHSSVVYNQTYVGRC